MTLELLIERIIAAIEQTKVELARSEKLLVKQRHARDRTAKKAAPGWIQKHENQCALVNYYTTEVEGLKHQLSRLKSLLD